ncbi:heavy metal-associated isoprenylated plant protein 33 [Ceratitis capitata]|uniref:heavy metal-associated isoprenylated plant protein 33 n=1 Tax=Ceratitis capitata TaxID=7213 RepID=UPI0006188287|nr:heavy metal-associated isoprenylated plant protein 33 [Ceratitis capitata]
MRSFILLTVLSALACVPSQAQFSFPGSQSALGNNRFPRQPAQTSNNGINNPNNIDAGLAGSRYPAAAGLSNGGFGASSNYPGAPSVGVSPASATSGNPNNRILGLLGGGGGGGLFSNLIGALTGRNRNPIGGGGGGGFGAYPYPVPVPYPGYSPYGPPSPYGPGFGYPGFGGSYYG